MDAKLHEHGLRPGEVLLIAALLMRGAAAREAPPATAGRGDDESGDGEILGGSVALRSVLHRVRQIAPTTYPVVLTGETGTGKELLARRIHAWSDRSAGPFVAVNCAAIPDTLLESELFGIEAGVATGVRRRTGRFEEAEGGTLFLDEIADLPPPAQSALLRALEGRCKEIAPLGARGVRRLDVRIVAAGGPGLDQAVASGRLRKDLWYRLAAFVLEVPALRDRPGDVRVLAFEFALRAAAEFRKRIDRLSEEAAGALEAYAWPGNVRELQNVMARAVLFAGGEVVEITDLPPEITGRSADGPLAPARLSRLSYREARLDFDREFFRAHEEICAGNVSEIARRTGLARRHLYRRLRSLGLLDPSRR